jgi:hypothetical protein
MTGFRATDQTKIVLCVSACCSVYTGSDPYPPIYKDWVSEREREGGRMIPDRKFIFCKAWNESKQLQNKFQRGQMLGNSRFRRIIFRMLFELQVSQIYGKKVTKLREETDYSEGLFQKSNTQAEIRTLELCWINRDGRDTQRRKETLYYPYKDGNLFLLYSELN